MTRRRLPFTPQQAAIIAAMGPAGASWRDRPKLERQEHLRSSGSITASTCSPHVQKYLYYRLRNDLT